MRYYYKDNKGNLFNYKSEHFVKYKEVTETITLTDEEGNPFLDENGEPITQTITKTVRDGLQDGYTQITEEEFKALTKPPVFQVNENQKQINVLKNKLNNTDYIVLKIAEAVADNDTATVTALKTEYATELANRKEWRNQINELEREV